MSNAYAPLFCLLDEPDILCVAANRPRICILLSMLTMQKDVRTFRIRKLCVVADRLDMRRKYPRDRDVYMLLNTFSIYVPTILVPERQDGIQLEWTVRRRVLANWATCQLPQVLGRLRDITADKQQVISLTSQSVQIAYLCGRTLPVMSLEDANDLYGEVLAASLGHVHATSYLKYETEVDTINDVPLFDPRNSAVLDQAATMCDRIGEVPPTLFRFLTHVVQSMCVSAVRCLEACTAMSTWEATWRPSVGHFARFVVMLRNCNFADIESRILRPFVYLGTLDGVSDGLSAVILRSLGALYRSWRVHGTVPRLREMLLELEQAVLVIGVPSLSLCDAACFVHSMIGDAGDHDALQCTYPLPFYLLVSPVGFSGSLVTLAHCCEMVLRMRRVGADAMVVALVELLWSGRAFGILQQQGVAVDGGVACDGSTFAALRAAVDTPNAPSGLIGSLSHGALLAPLFERFVNVCIR